MAAYLDNKSVIESVNPTNLVDDRILCIDIEVISETLNNEKNTNVKWCTGKDQLANCMTQRGAYGFELLYLVQSGKFVHDF